MTHMTHNNSGDTRRNTNNNKGSFLNSRARFWFFTINNFDSEDLEKLYSENFRGLVFQDEVGASGTPHLQGTIAYKNQRTGRSMKKKWPRANFGICRNIRACRKYCNKDDTWGGQYKYHSWEGTVVTDIRPNQLVRLSEIDNSTALVIWKPLHGSKDWVKHTIIPEFEKFITGKFNTVRKFKEEDDRFWIRLKDRGL